MTFINMETRNRNMTNSDSRGEVSLRGWRFKLKGRNQIGASQIGLGYPLVVFCGIPLPSDPVLQGLSGSMSALAAYSSADFRKWRRVGTFEAFGRPAAHGPPRV